MRVVASSAVNQPFAMRVADDPISSVDGFSNIAVPFRYHTPDDVTIFCAATGAAASVKARSPAAKMAWPGFFDKNTRIEFRKFFIC